MINGNYTPLNLNCIAHLLQNSGLTINPEQVARMGVSTTNTTYTTRGTVYTNTLLNKLADITTLAYTMIGTDTNTQITQSTYNNLINMGSSVPALGNRKPTTYTGTYTGEMTKYGWLRLIPYQAYQELHINGGNSYSNFLNTFMACDGYLSTSNSLIKTYSMATTFLKTTYSTMNDLITSDITGVSLSTVYWGKDLIRVGRAIDLRNISQFGLPSILLKTLVANNALTDSLKVALISAGFSDSEIQSIVDTTATTAQEKNLYGAFCVLMGTDLIDICTLLNCQTQKLRTLADLLDPKYLFPESYQTLTYPKYNLTIDGPTNSRTYYRIYINGSVDTGITETLGLRLIPILPKDIACACDAFSVAMMQIKNIQNMNIEKFSQVVTNLENVSNMETGSTSYPINPELAQATLALIAKGSGPNNTYTTLDFFGAMTSLHYDFVELESILRSLNTATLLAIYNQIYALLTGPGPFENDLITYINNANTEITNVYNGNTVLADKINTLYNKFGTYLTKEQEARAQALPFLSSISTSTQDVYGFVNNLNEFAMQTQDAGPAIVLENIADTTTVGGNSLIGSMREVRNSARLGLVGGKLDSGIDSSKLLLPRVTGSTSGQSPIEGYTPSSSVSNIPIVTGAAIVPGSFAGSPEVRLIPPNLSVFNTGVMSSVLTPSVAVDEVIKCNCDCWDNLQ